MKKASLKIQNCYSWLECPDQEIMNNLWKALRVRELNYQHSRLYKQKIWDGFTDYFKKETGRFLTGLLPEVKAALKVWGVEYEIIDDRKPVKFLYDEISSDFLNQWSNENNKINLYDYQVDLVNQVLKHHRGIITPSTGGGKAQPLSSLVYTPTGPVPMKDVKIGMKICNSYGGTSKITGVFPQGIKDVYKITFNNGDTVECCEDHLWNVEETSNCFKDKVFSTRYLIENLKSPSGKCKFGVKNPKCLKFKYKKTKIVPYLLGLLLGDGRFHKSMIGFSNVEKQLINSVKAILQKDYDLKHDSKNDYYIAKRKRGKKENLYLNAIKSYGLENKKSHEKFIPDDFKYNSKKTRLALVQGLMDTDGTTEKNGKVYLSTSSKIMAYDFKEIIESLGMICRITYKTPKFKYKGIKKEGKLNYIIIISSTDYSNIFKLKRKLKRTHKKHRQIRRIIKSIEKVRREECQCIMTDAVDHLYLTDNCILTHNTEIMISLLKCIPKNCPTLILANKKSLVEQNYLRLKEWKFENFGRLYDKYIEPNIITCATVQSLHKIESLLPDIKVVIVDEIHEMMSKLPKKYYGKLKNASVRVAVSATWEKFGGKDHSQRYSVKGYFGPVLKTTSEIAVNGLVKTKQLQERGTLAKSNCIFYPINEPELLYEIYLDAVTQGIAKNIHFHNVVNKIANKCKGRTLILVERIEHGDTLHALIKDSIWVTGKDNLDTRKFVIDKLHKNSTEKNVVAIATNKIFDAGIDVHIHNLINAAGGQAEHIIIQRMGRGLRPAKDKEMLNYIDFVFNINEYLLKHSKKRIKILEKEGHQIIVKPDLSEI